MKKVMLSLVCLAILALGSVAAFASDGNSPLRTNIPFAFNIQNVSFDAGTYTIYQANGILHVRNESDKTDKVFLVVPTDRGEIAPSNELRFMNVDGTKYLTKVWGMGRQTGLELIYSKKTADQIMVVEGSR